ncbi:HD-GYP domain-containing protein [Psychromonas antarctica]|uniref:HD-GYP domain-containing protein n=1 Tax=Psychromonas antarctica TaxID=67573 RepID=UPI001EE7BEB3|nr:DUF3391 domain-containing protein [Psychromonas antarctica]MCG6201637.1 DUF3391 domain-containing protein [Psychromonas antarctica]
MSRIKLSTDRLTTGLYIKLPCSWSEHPFLFGSFKIQEQEQVKVLQSLQFKHVLFYPDKSDGLPLPANTEKAETENKEEQKSDYLNTLWIEKEQRIEEQQVYIRNLKKCENDFKQSLTIVRSINLKLEKQASSALEDAKELITDITNKLNHRKNPILHLMEEGKEGDKYHSHVFHVAILSMLLGKALALSQQELIYLGLGALFHDMGISKIPTQILYNNPNITQAEKNYLKLHVRYGLDKISHIADFPAPASEIIAQHHEHLDGSGYPQGLSDQQISLLTQIVTIADEYDTLCNPSDKHPARTPSHALSFLYKNRKEQLNTKVLGLLIKELGIYPPGSIVQLCNQKLALVMSVSKDNILQPNVLIYDPAIPKNNAPIISLSKLNLKIEKVILPWKLPENIQEYLNPRVRVNYYFEHAEER